uniref:ELMO domain-containing protein 2 n=1 Tax=Aceria tosichella TaxID=561515 RepID=A0A6G1S965_9ACAR
MAIEFIRIMFGELVHRFKLLLIFIYDLVYRFEKYIKFLLTGRHEFERICELPCDIYEKTMQLDRWLMRSKCRPIRKFYDNNLDHTRLNCPDENIKNAIEKILYSYKQHDGLHFSHHEVTKEARANLPSQNSDPLLAKHLEDGDLFLVELLNELTDKFVRIILRAKRVKLNANNEAILRDCIYRIISYNLSLVIALKIASIRYDSSIPSHKGKLVSLWNNLIQADEETASKKNGSRAFPPEQINSVITPDDSIVSSRWSLIGFQGEDPGTDFRGMGLLGLEQLEYLSRKSKYLARDLLKRSLDSKYEYPFAITGINITYHLVKLYKDGSMKHLYYDYGDSLFRNKRRNLNLIKTLNDLYVELYLRFDCFWRESKPENILVFNELMEDFVNIIRMDMSCRNFSMKFIY